MNVVVICLDAGEPTTQTLLEIVVVVERMLSHEGLPSRGEGVVERP